MAAGAVAVIKELLGNPAGLPISVTVADGTAIPKGTLMVVTDPRTAIAQTTTPEPFIGIAAAQKVANDGSTRLAVWTNGIFAIEAGAAITAGARLMTGAEANKVITADAAGLLVSTVGTALETAAGDTDVILVKIGAGY